MHYSDIVELDVIYWDGTNAEEIKQKFPNSDIMSAVREDGTTVLLVDRIHIIEPFKFISRWEDDGEMDPIPWEPEELMTKQELIDAIEKEIA